MNLIRQQRRYRILVSALLALAILGIFVMAVAADAPDPKLTPPPVVSVTHQGSGATATTTVTVTGEWLWSTHHSDCNFNRAGVGFAVDWNDPTQPGNHVTFLDLNGDGVITKTLNGPDDISVGAAAANERNPADNVVHPTPGQVVIDSKGRVVADGTGKETDVALPSQYALWRGGCGTFTRDVNGDGVKDPEGVWGPRNHVLDATGADTGAQAGISHTYLDVSVVESGITICALMYDVHGKSPSDNGGVGIPNGVKEITAGGGGHNGDNGAEKNSGTPLGNACAPILIQKPSTTTTTPSLIPNDTGTVTGNNPTGSLTFELFRPAAGATCSGTPAFSQTVALSGGSASTSNTSFVASDVGTWRWRLSYSGDTRNPPATSACGIETFEIGNS
jgi:hypothetical protein